MRKTALICSLLLCIFGANAQKKVTKDLPQQLIEEATYFWKKVAYDSTSLYSLELDSRQALKIVYANPKKFIPKSIRQLSFEQASKLYNYMMPYNNAAPNRKFPYIADVFTGTVYEITFKIVPTAVDSAEKENNHVPVWNAIDKAQDLLMSVVDFHTYTGRATNIGEQELRIFVYANMQRYNTKLKHSVYYSAPLYYLSSDDDAEGFSGHKGHTGLFAQKGNEDFERISEFSALEKKQEAKTKPAEQPVQQVASAKKETVSVIPILRPKKGIDLRSPTMAFVYVPDSATLSIGDMQNYDNDSVTILIYDGKKISENTQPFEIQTIHWKTFKIKPGSTVVIRAISEGKLPPCTVGVKLSNGKSFTMQSKKGETMSIWVQKEE